MTDSNPVPRMTDEEITAAWAFVLDLDAESTVRWVVARLAQEAQRARREEDSLRKQLTALLYADPLIGPGAMGTWTQT